MGSSIDSISRRIAGAPSIGPPRRSARPRRADVRRDLRGSSQTRGRRAHRTRPETRPRGALVTVTARAKQARQVQGTNSSCAVGVPGNPARIARTVALAILAPGHNRFRRIRSRRPPRPAAGPPKRPRNRSPRPTLRSGSRFICERIAEQQHRHEPAPIVGQVFLIMLNDARVWGAYEGSERRKNAKHEP